MGTCWCKDMAPEDAFEPPSTLATSTSAMEPRVGVPKVVDPVIVDQLVLELLTLIASFVDK